MKAIEITMHAGSGVHLPLSYQHIVQSMLYSCWQSIFPDLHGERNIKLFCFSRLEGNYHLEQAQIVFTGPVVLEVRSARDELIDALAKEILRCGFLQLGSNTATIERLKIQEHLIFPDRACIQMRSPVTVHETLEDGKTRYFHPEEPEWGEKIASNLRSKLKALNMDICSDFYIETAGFDSKKQVSKFKNTFITGYTGSFIVSTTSTAMKALYYCGIGNRNSQGFGMFDII